MIQDNLDMARKTKQIEKDPKETPNNSKTKPTPETLHSPNDLFSQQFRERLTQFIALTNEVLTLKHGGDVGNEIKETKLRMIHKIEQSASEILRDELSSLEEQISEQKEKIEHEISKINKAYEQSRSSLMSTQSFSEEQVKTQLVSIRKRAEEKQRTCDNYEELLGRAQAILAEK